MESPTSETLGREDRTPVVGACSCCLLLYIFFLEEIRQSRNLWEGNILDFFFFFYKVAVLPDAICEVQAKNWFGKDFFIPLGQL